MASLEYIISIAIKKARQSGCRYRVSAVGLDKRGNVVGYEMNQQRIDGYGGGLHAEAHLIRRHGKKIKSIFVCRVNPKGKLMPIEPCKACKKLLKKLEIKVYTIKEK